jgi:putative DNA primase/helicase
MNPLKESARSDQPARFRVLGFSADSIVIYDRQRKIVRSLKDGDLRAGVLVSVAGLEWLMQRFPGKGLNGFDQLAAADWFNKEANRLGHFDESQVKGRGASNVDNQLIYHAGDRLVVGGEIRDLEAVEVGVYPQGASLPLPATEGASAAQGALLVKVATAFPWDDPTSGLLLAGWCALAPLCGALAWRPHLWITGGAGSGKTTVLNEFVLPLLNGSALFVQGNTTEAGLRQKLGHDALPIVMDEGEQSDDRERGRVQDVVTLLRQSSSETGARTLRGTAGGKAMDFMVRSMACIASIQISLQNQADIERFAVLELKQGGRGPSEESSWSQHLENLNDLRSQDLPAKLHRRMIDNFDHFLRSLPAFRRVCLSELGSPRYADQYGSLITAAWVMSNDGIATDVAATEFMSSWDWSGRQPERDNDDPQQALGALLQAPLRLGTRDCSVFDLIAEVVAGKLGGSSSGDFKEADRHLRNLGMIVWLKPKPILLVGRNTRVHTLLRDTPYRSSPAKLFERLPGAERWPTPQTFTGVVTRATAVPLSLIAGLPSTEALQNKKTKFEGTDSS